MILGSHFIIKLFWGNNLLRPSKFSIRKATILLIKKKKII
jgi:hypothetical protein